MLKARKWLNFRTPPLFEAPRSGGTPQNVGMKFGVRKLESWGYQMKKSRFDAIRARDRRTDRQTRCDRKDPR